MDGVGQERQAAAQREVPEVTRDHALALDARTRSTGRGSAPRRTPAREIRCRARADPWSSSHPHRGARRLGGRARAAGPERRRRGLTTRGRTWRAGRCTPCARPPGGAGPRRARRSSRLLRSGTVLLLSPTSVRSRRGTSSATDTRYRLSIEIDFSPRSTSPMNFPLSPDPLPSRSWLSARCLRRARRRCPRNFPTCLTARSVTGRWSSW